MKLQTARGVRDYKPEEKVLRQEIVETLKSVFELYGYVPIETPIIERYDVLSAKFAAGEESDALKETFRFKDQGKRELGLRYDLTVPFARFVGMNPTLKMPFKRYQIGRVYRDGPIKSGRYREFWQCDFDVVGTSSMLADAEIITATLEALKKLGLNTYMRVSNRKLLNGILEYAGVKEEERETAIITIDKLDKFGVDLVKKELKEKGVDEEAVEKIMNVFADKNDLKKLKVIISSKEGLEGIKELEELFNYISVMETKNVELDVSLARGLVYYTGTVFEAMLRGIKESIAGGGRFDDLIGRFTETGEYPAVGISFGFERIFDELKITKKKKTITKVYIIPIKTTEQSLKIAQQLRKVGINTDIDLVQRGPSKNLDYADKLKIPYVVFVGEKELEQEKVKLRDMKSGKEQFLSVEELISTIK